MVPHSLTEPAARNLQPPSRHDNPFATCWTRPGSLPFHFQNGQTVADLVDRLAAQSWRGAIVGPHGSGKSTLLETLKPALAAAGRTVLSLTLNNGTRRLPHNAWEDWEPAVTIVIVDGYEQLSWLERSRLLRRSRRARVGLVVTTHRASRIPLLTELAPDRGLVLQLVAQLCAKVSTPITVDHVISSHACNGSNVREIFFDLYDRQERARRPAIAI